MQVLCVVAGPELGGPGGAAAEQQLHRGAAGRHLLGAGASEELQGLSALQHRPEERVRYAFIPFPALSLVLIAFVTLAFLSCTASTGRSSRGNMLICIAGLHNPCLSW